MVKRKDYIYKRRKKLKNFSFDHEVSQVFDDTVERSIPNYNDIQKIISNLLKKKIEPNTNIYDLGTGTGNTLFLLSKDLEDRFLTFIGIDNSKDMLYIANEKKQFENYNDIYFLYGDILDPHNYENAGAFILNLTLQFIRPIDRGRLIKYLYKKLRPNGMLILFEKIIEEDSEVTRDFIDLYYDFKHKNGYSWKEIKRKRIELENVLIPFTEKENVKLLVDAGFKVVTTMYKNLNFCVILAIKR